MLGKSLNYLCALCLSTLSGLRAVQMPGKLVDIGDCKMHIYCTGNPDAPTVILDSCLGGNSLWWSLVQPAMSEFAYVCSYDRAGLGWSDSSNRERTSKNMAEELHLFLEKSGIKTPYILVGNSSGGITMRVFAHMYTEDVYGVILVDSSHEDQLDRFKEVDEKFPVEEEIKICPQFPQHLQDDLNAIHSPKAEETGKQECEFFSESMKQLKASKNELTDKPLIVITACKKREDMVNLKSQKARMHEYDRLWEDFQKNFLNLSIKSKQIFADKSLHFIMIEQPEIVIEAVRSMVDQYHKSH